MKPGFILLIVTGSLLLVVGIVLLIVYFTKKKYLEITQIPKEPIESRGPRGATAREPKNQGVRVHSRGRPPGGHHSAGRGPLPRTAGAAPERVAVRRDVRNSRVVAHSKR